MTAKKSIYLLPNLLTTAALFCGFYSILAAMNGKLEIAAIAIFVAMILDGLDGRVARMINAQSDFGAEFDSLADMISFGLAPAIIVYLWALSPMKELSLSWGRLGWMVAFLYVVCAAIRLARFNTQRNISEKRYFIGLPSPSAAAVLAGMLWVFHETDSHHIAIQIAVVGITLTTGLLMVSNFKFRSFKDFDFKNQVPYTTVLIIALIFAITFIDPARVLFAAFFAYMLSGPVVWLFSKRKNNTQ
ncbi:MAG: CDP-diacylglycerol--serine O-phosphatidyltransferase [Thiotrichaceae bacterium]|nr:CDP-diacylglycerol--serine O-phosphatidyltransferase [Thiotrichaceae bacterium]